MKNLKEAIQANLSGAVNEENILKAIKRAYRHYSVFDSEEEATLYLVSTYNTEPSKVMEQDSYSCEIKGRVLSDRALIIEGSEAQYISTFKVCLTSYSHDAAMDEEDYAFVINISEN